MNTHEIEPVHYLETYVLLMSLPVKRPKACNLGFCCE